MYLSLSITLYSQELGDELVGTRAEPRANDYVIELTRSFSRELFDANGSAWAKPLVEATNASVNSRFFSNAFIPREVDEPYFKIGVHLTMGFIPDSKKWMQPSFPVEEFSEAEMAEYISFGLVNGQPGITSLDTAGLALYLLKTIIYDGLNTDNPDNQISIPERAPTLMGDRVDPNSNAIAIPQGALGNLLMERLNSLSPLIRDNLPEELVANLQEGINQVPTYFTLPNGSGISQMTFGVPQLEVGSLFGTELLLRYIPQLDYGENIGEFGFWGVGISHSLSQYFFDADSLRTFDLAIQAAYQASTLDQVFGVTNGTFTAEADIFNINIHGSMPIKDWFDVYAGYQFETLNIASKIKYYIGVEQQAQLGMLEYEIYRKPDGTEYELIAEPNPENGYPGDTEPQYTDIGFVDQNHKIVFGAYKRIGPVALVMDYSISQFNLFSFGVKYIID